MIGSLLIIFLGPLALVIDHKYNEYKTNKKCEEYFKNHPYKEYKTQHEIEMENNKIRIYEDVK